MPSPSVSAILLEEGASLNPTLFFYHVLTPLDALSEKSVSSCLLLPEAAGEAENTPPGVSEISVGRRLPLAGGAARRERGTTPGFPPYLSDTDGAYGWARDKQRTAQTRYGLRSSPVLYKQKNAKLFA